MKRKQYSTSAPDAKQLKTDETQTLFQSKLFDLQSEELIKEVTLTPKQKLKSDKFLHELSDLLQSLKDGPQRMVNDTDWMKKENLKSPLPSRIHSGDNKNLRFTFRAPKVVQVIGSYTLGTSVRPRIQADLLLEMPKDSVEAKDYMNRIYLQKRALYLAELALRLKRQPNSIVDVDKLSYVYDNSDDAKPFLNITPKGSLGNHFCVRIHTCPEGDLWKRNRFQADKSNLRVKCFLNSSNQSEAADKPTPLYNALIGRDLVYRENLMNIHANIRKGRVIKDAIRLLKVWIHQRQFNTRIGGFDGFQLTLYVSRLVEEKHLTPRMSEQQCVRVIFTRLSEEAWPAYLADKCKDDEGSVDYAVNACVEEYKLVSAEASLALNCLDDNRDGTAFDKLFITNMSNDLKFDQILTVDISNTAAIVKVHSAVATKQQLMDAGNDHMVALLPELRQLVKRALGDRLSAPPSFYYGHTSAQWSVTEKCPVRSTKLNIGLQFDHQKWTQVQDKCTMTGETNQKEIKEFRQFWGDKCELRRFADGSICESVLWSPSTTAADKRTVAYMIVKYALRRHVNLEVMTSADPMTLLQLPLGDCNTPVMDKTYGTGEEIYTSAVVAAEQLCKDLRNLSNNDIPLLIVATHLLSPTFRATETFPLRKMTFNTMLEVDGREMFPKDKHPCPMHVPVLEVLCMLEASGQWPEDVNALARVKAAMLMKLNMVLRSKLRLLTRARTKHIDVYREHYLFRLRIGYAREMILHRMFRENSDAPLKMIDTSKSLQLQYQINYLPKVCNYINGVNQANLTSYGSACRLCKRWLSSQMLLDDSCMFTELSVELIVAYLYIQPLPFSTPVTPNVAFRRFLNLLASYNFTSKPLIVNFNEELTGADFSRIESLFKKQKREDLPSMLIVTPQDVDDTMMWKRQVAPSTVVFNYCRSLAKQAVRQDFQSEHFIVKSLFTPSYDCFDAVLTLQTRQLCRGYQALSPAPNACVPYEGSLRATNKLPVSEYDPAVIYLTLLRDSFDEIAVFFHDVHGGDKIAVLWRPNCFKEDSKDSEYRENKVKAIVEDFEILGKGIVKDIEIK